MISLARVAALISAGFAVVLLSRASATEIYKWVDENGITNYSNVAPPNRASKTLDEDAGRVSTVEAPGRTRNDSAQGDRALRDQLDRVEQELARSRQMANQQDLAGSDAYTRWREECIAQRRTDCDNPYETVYAPSYIGPSPPLRPRPPLRPIGPTPTPPIAPPARPPMVRPLQ